VHSPPISSTRGLCPRLRRLWGTHHTLKKGRRPWNCGRLLTTGSSSASKSSRLIISMYFATQLEASEWQNCRLSTSASPHLSSDWTVLVSRQQDQGSKTKTETVKTLSRDCLETRQCIETTHYWRTGLSNSVDGLTTCPTMSTTDQC